MSYIGSTPTTQSFIAGTDYFNGTGAQINFTLSRSVNSVNDIEVIVNNVEQIPSGYSVSGTTLTFSAAPSAGTSNVYVRYLSTTNLSLAIPAGTSATFNTAGVTTLGVTGVASFADGSAAAPSITNEGDTNTGIFFPAADTIAFAEGGVESMRINSLGYVTYTANPAFNASLNGAQQNVTSGSSVVLTFGTVNQNRGSGYNGSTYTFTAPVAGMYQLNARARVDGIAGGNSYAILTIFTTGQTYNSICSASGAYNNISLSVATYMALGHTAYVSLNSAGQTINAVNTQPVYSDFSGFLIG